MFNSNNKDDQRLKNMIFFNTPMTDQELEDASPAIAILIVIVVVAAIVICIVS